MSLVNGSFEQGTTGWTYPGNPGDYVDFSVTWQASSGSYSVDLNGFHAGWISQNIATFPGAEYVVQFDLAGNPGWPQGVKTLEVSAAGTTAEYSFNTTGRSVSNMGWTPETFRFTATGTTTTLMFKSTYQGNAALYGWRDPAQGPALDNVRVTFVPAPTTTTVTYGPGPFVYTGSAFTATASVSPVGAGTPTITYAGDCTNAGGTCTATATFAASGKYAASSATANITIDRAPTTTAAAFGASSVVYTGSPFTATGSVSPAAAGAATVSYSGDCTNAGTTCTATASFGGSGNYLPSTSASVGLTIDRAPSTTTVTFGSGPFIYNGRAFTATATVSPTAAGTAAIAYSGECTFAGTCTASATFAGSGNFLPSRASTSILITYPVATSANQCKNGGWQYLTDDLGNRFKNQGDCVSYVATKGRNKGAGGS